MPDPGRFINISGKLPQHTLTFVGGGSIIVAGLGLWFNYSTLVLADSFPLGQMIKEHDLKNFYPIFYTMSAICIAFYVILLACGVQLIRKKSGWGFVLLTVVVLELLYFTLVGWLWAYSPYRFSIGAATGISSGGLMYQAYVVFPIWAPLLSLWARRRMIRP